MRFYIKVAVILFMATRVIPVMANGNNVQPVCTEKGALSGKDSNQSALIGA